MSFLEKVNSPYIRHTKKRIYQGDIYKDITLQFAEQKDGDLLVQTINLVYVCVLTQDCDLQQDFDNRARDEGKHNNYLPCILICPAYQAKKFRVGEHISEQRMRTFNEKEFTKLRNNDSERRYHWLPEDSQFYIPEIIIDFKHYYAIPRHILYSLFEKNYIATIIPLFRENLSHRFSNYLSRIGLPEIISETQLV